MRPTSWILLALTVLPAISILPIVAAQGPTVTVIREETVILQADKYYAVPVNLTSNQQFYYKVTLLSGPKIDVLIMSWPNFEKYEKNPSNATVVYETSASATNVDEAQRAFLLNNGSWAFVIDNTKAGVAKPSLIQKQARLDFMIETPTSKTVGPGEAPLSAGGVIAAVVILLIVVLFVVGVAVSVTRRAREAGESLQKGRKTRIDDEQD